MNNYRGSEIYKTELNLINDDKLRSEIEFLLDRYVEEANFIKPASSTGKYHPEFAKGDGGLVRHTKAVVKILTALQGARPSLDWDAIYAAAILHDGWKYTNSSKFTSKNHAVEGANAIGFRMATIDDPPLKEKLKLIGMIVLGHMGRFGIDNFEEQAKDLPEEVLLVHYADIIASRTWYNPTNFFLTEEDLDEIKNRAGK